MLSADECNIDPASQIGGRIVWHPVGGSAKLIVCAGARFGVGCGHEKSCTEGNFFSHRRFTKGSSNSTHRVATLFNLKLDVTIITIAIGAGRACGNAIVGDHVLAVIATDL